MSKLVIHLFLNGELVYSHHTAELIQPNDILIAVDGGLKHIIRMGLTPSLLIGDLDSVTTDELARVESLGVGILRFPPEKDQTDFELALIETANRNPDRVYIHAALGGRTDHILANLALAAADRFEHLNLTIIHGNQRMKFFRGSLSIRGNRGDLISLLAWQNPVEGVTTTNLSYPLTGEILYPDSSRGISNVMLTNEAIISTNSGRLLCIHTQK